MLNGLNKHGCNIDMWIMLQGYRYLALSYAACSSLGVVDSLLLLDHISGTALYMIMNLPSWSSVGC